ncbi:follistatin-related protein 1-like [Cylas formicarius]|uniref:follistatin-related protein 1-like n=1 Tax=Cylas formicarius TaxID=197179 RepID=UPI002958C74A|nr:follistatin-related protein 1-like [Cylas formicarius]
MKVALCVIASFVCLFGASKSLEVDGVLDAEGFPLCVCPRHYAPVCASNGQTYSNYCSFECDAKKITSRGQVGIRVLSNGRCDDQNEISKLSESVRQRGLNDNPPILEVPIEPVFY